MSKNYIVINGKKAELTEEQLKALGIKIESDDNPFADGTEKYVETVVEPGGVDRVLNNPSLVYSGLAFKDKDFAKQVVLHQLLYRKLLKYACENDAFANDWLDLNSVKYLISKHTGSNKIVVDFNYEIKHSNVVYFTDKKVAEQAIEDVILPFMVEHPEFVW